MSIGDYKDTDSMLMKQQLNAIYGAGITHAFPHRKSFIVLHCQYDEKTKPIIIFTDGIVAFNDNEIYAGGVLYNVKETITEIASKLHKIGMM